MKAISHDSQSKQVASMLWYSAGTLVRWISCWLGFNRFMARVKKTEEIRLNRNIAIFIALGKTLLINGQKRGTISQRVYSEYFEYNDIFSRCVPACRQYEHGNG